VCICRKSLEVYQTPYIKEKQLQITKHKSKEKKKRMFKVNKTSSKNAQSKPVAVMQEEAQPMIKLKPIENSKLYRRRSLSRENIAKRNRQKSDSSGPRHDNDVRPVPSRNQQSYQTKNSLIVDKTHNNPQARYGNGNTSSTMAAHVNSGSIDRQMAQSNDVLDKFKVMELVYHRCVA
jgi:hypothetical protein